MGRVNHDLYQPEQTRRVSTLPFSSSPLAAAYQHRSSSGRENGDGGCEESTPSPPSRPGGGARAGCSGFRPRRSAAPVVHDRGGQGLVPRQGRGRRPRRLRRQELPEGGASEGELRLSRSQ
jgi:hypothetical protein